MPIDRPLPATFAAPLQIALTTVAPAGPNVTVTAANQLQFPAGTAPGEGSLGIVGAGAAGVPVRVVGPPAGDVVTVDATLPAATVGTAVPFRAVTGASPLGTRDAAPEAGNQLTYRPLAAGQAPDGSGAAPVVVRIDAGADVAVRRLTGAPVHDVVQLDRPIPGAAPWRVDRMRPAAGRRAATALTLERVVGLVVAEPDAIADAPALLLSRVAGAPPTAGPQILASVDVVGTQVTTPATPPGSMPARPTVGEPFLVGAEVCAVRSLRVRVTLDRDVALPAGEHRLVGLVQDGPRYGATRLSDTQVVVVPEDDSAGGAPVPTAFPRFAEGDLVQISGATTDTFRVTAVDGLQLTVTGGSAAAVPANADRVERLDVNDPMNGGPFLGLRAQPVAGAPRSIEVDVWTANSLPANLLVGIVTADGAATHPARVSVDDQALTITLAEPATNVRGVPIAQLSVAASGYAARIARDGNVVLLADAPANVATQSGQTLVVVAQRSNSVTAAGRLQSGTMLVPEDEDEEHGRRQALVDHELTHTLQYAKWGPLWFNFFPMLALELPGILATDAELPEYSPFMEAMLTAGAGTNWDMQIRDLHGVTISSGDKLQVLSGSRIVQVEVLSVVQGSELNVRQLLPGARWAAAGTSRGRAAAPPRSRSGLARSRSSWPLHVELGELCALAVAVEADQEAVVERPGHRTVRVVLVDRRATRDHDVALDGVRRVVRVVRPRRVPGGRPRRVALAEPCSHHRLAADERLVVRVEAVGDVLGEQRPDVVAVVGLPRRHVVVEPALGGRAIHASDLRWSIAGTGCRRSTIRAGFVCLAMALSISRA